MRRLATQSRGGAVNSQRDYQTISDLGKPLCFKPEKPGESEVMIKYEARDHDEGFLFAGVGGYLAATATVDVQVEVDDGTGRVAGQVFRVEDQRYWTRIGVPWALKSGLPSAFSVRLKWKGSTDVWVWGLNCGGLSLSTSVLQAISIKGLTTVLKPMHLPEGLFLNHDSALAGGDIVEAKNVKWVEPDRPTDGKKCCQCQRGLPVDPRLADMRKTTTGRGRSPKHMLIAFHGHRSKATGHQNECVACKKFEINDHFNPIRTSDQLHESSTLTRERKRLLRDGDVLERFKERVTKEGFRTFVWKRFNKKCFKCDTPVGVDEYHLDHTRPLAYLWPLDEYATCLCSDCNNNKKDSFPSEFYSPEQLKMLSTIVGLPLVALQRRAVNPDELARIRADIVGFAKSWDARLFASVASRVGEMHSEIDLDAELKAADTSLHDQIVEALRNRPASVLEGEADAEPEEDEEIDLFEELGIDTPRPKKT